MLSAPRRKSCCSGNSSAFFLCELRCVYLSTTEGAPKTGEGDGREFEMKKLFAASAVLIALTGAAGAADLGGSKDTSTSVFGGETHAFNWRGAYITGRIGGATNSHDMRASESIPATCHLNGAYDGISGSADVNGVSQAECESVNGSDYGQFVHADYIDAHTVGAVIDNLGNSTLVGGFGGGYRAQFGSIVVGAKAAYDISGGESEHNLGGEKVLKIKDGNSISLLSEFGYVSGRAMFHGDVGYGWTKATYVGVGENDGNVKKQTGHVIAGGGVSYAITDHITVDASYEHWFGAKKTIISGEGFSLTDDKSADRAILSVGYKF